MTKLKCLYLNVLLLMFVGTEICQANDELNAKAAQFYTAQNWSQAIKAYEQITQSESSNEQAWFRLAESYLRLEQGQPALDANEHLSEAQQIPASLVLYQKAQALHILGRESAMMNALESAAKQGYSQLNNLTSQSMWSTYQNNDVFKSVIQQVDKNARPCMHDEKYRAFDFWLGEWEVYGNLQKTGPLFGHNSITQNEQGCLIMERWQGASGSTGTSMNYYNGITNQWVQHWVSGGVVIDYSGGLIKIPNHKKVMQLKGKIHYASTHQQPQIRDFRGTWTPLKDDVVQQFFEESLDGGKTWNVWFNGFYFPINDEVKNVE